jgi:Tol biopolymer transport system component
MRGNALLIAVFGAALLLLASAASAAHPGQNGRIAFVRVVVASADPGAPVTAPAAIFTVAADGSDLKPVGASGARPYSYEPSWSPDGEALAFSGFVESSPTLVDASRELFVVSADGLRLRQLTTNRVYDKTPTWSADGSRLAFERAGGIWVMRADGTRARRIVADAKAPAWSPDGRLIAFIGRGSAIEVVRPDGSGRRRIGRSSYYGSKFGFGEAVEWTADGRVVYVDEQTEVRTMSSSGGAGRRVGSGRQPAWSPDGKRVVVTVWSEVDSTPDRLDVMSADGSGRRALTRGTSLVSDFDPDWQPLCTRRGGAKRDTIAGTAARELLCGRGGADRIDGARGLDRIFGGAGNDVLAAVDGGFDVVGCGLGLDTVRADGGDLVGVDCERIRRS